MNEVKTDLMIYQSFAIFFGDRFQFSSKEISFIEEVFLHYNKMVADYKPFTKVFQYYHPLIFRKRETYNNVNLSAISMKRWRLNTVQ